MDTREPSKESCPYCHFVAELDFSIRQRRYFRCKSCDLIFQSNLRVEAAADLLQYYQHYYFSEFAQDQLSGFRQHVYSHVLNLMESKTAIGRVLDVGCGCGFFLRQARDRGWDIAGIDPSEESIAYADKLLGANIALNGTLADLSQEEAYDVITMINVLEHASKPWSDVQKAKSLLKRGGLIFLRMPNAIVHTSLRKISKIFQSEFGVEKYLIFHEYSFTPRFMRRLLGDISYRNITVLNATTLSEGILPNPLLRKLAGVMANLLRIFDGSKIILSPSMEVMAWRD